MLNLSQTQWSSNARVDVFVKQSDSLIKSHYHFATGRVQCIESMSLFKFCQSHRLKQETVSPSELKIWKHASHNNMKNKISSFTPYYRQNIINQGSMTWLNFIIIRASSNVLDVVIQVHKYCPFTWFEIL